MKKTLLLSVIGFMFAALASYAQPGTIDPTFNIGTGPNNEMYVVKVQSDGKILICGGFTSYNGTSRNRIMRLNTDGSLDTGFNPGTGANSNVYVCAIQPDGKIIIGGGFTSYNGVTRNYLARLNANGSLDASFNTGTALNFDVKICSIQADGKIIVGGYFTNYNGSTTDYMVRLNANGTRDNGFNSGGTGFNSTPTKCTIQPDQKILVTGFFSTYNGVSSPFIVRLNTDGTLDNTFNVGTGTNAPIPTSTMQTDGKILIGGDFTSYNGTPGNGIIRINTDGSFDTGFDPGTGVNDDVVTIFEQQNGRLFLGGHFTTYNDTARNYMVLVNENGSIATDFNQGTGTSLTVTAAAVQNDGKIIVAGVFASYNGTPTHYLVRINGDLTKTGFTSIPAGCNASCDGDATLNVAGGTTGYTYLWDDPNAQTTATATGLCAGTYSVTVTDGANQTVSESIDVTEPTLLTNTGTVTNVACNGQCTGLINVTPGGGTPGYTYISTPGGVLNNLCAGTYTVTVSDQNGCTATEVYTVTEPPVALSADFTFVQNDPSVDFTGTVTGGTSSYFLAWDFGDGAPENNQNNPTHTYMADGTYIVTFCATDQNNCQTCSNHDVTITTTGIAAHSVENNNVAVYPIPAAGLLTIEVKGAASSNQTIATLYDVTGKLLQTRTANQNKFTIDISTLSKGIYVLSVFDGEKQVNKKIIKE